MGNNAVTVEGLPRLQTSMRAAGRQLQHMDSANAGVAATLAQRSRARAPKRSGRLARSITGRAAPGNAAEVTASVVYAGVIHNGWRRHNIAPNPFIAETVAATRAVWLETYRDETQRILDTVRGD